MANVGSVVIKKMIINVFYWIAIFTAFLLMLAADPDFGVVDLGKELLNPRVLKVQLWSLAAVVAIGFLLKIFSGYMAKIFRRMKLFKGDDGDFVAESRVAKSIALGELSSFFVNLSSAFIFYAVLWVLISLASSNWCGLVGWLILGIACPFLGYVLAFYLDRAATRALTP